MVTIIVGGQWGDEGKGKVVSYLALKDKPELVVRAGVGPNAGHTVMYEGKRYGVRQIPSGFVYEKAKLLIGAGVLIDPQVILKEIKDLGVGDRIGIDYRCGVIERKHRELDKGSEYFAKQIGSTGTGCGPANVDRVYRKLRQAKDVEELRPYLMDVAKEVNEALERGYSILVESTQGFGLSLYYGTYPYVTSKDTTASMACVDIGVGPKRVKDVIIVFKSFPTRVGRGPFPTEMSEEEAEKKGIVEYGTVTGRRRRVGYFDFEMAKYACMINSATQIALTCVDYLDKSVKGAREYRELTEKIKEFIRKLEDETKVPVTIVSTGPDLKDTIDLRKEKL